MALYSFCLGIIQWRSVGFKAWFPNATGKTLVLSAIRYNTAPMSIGGVRMKISGCMVVRKLKHGAHVDGMFWFVCLDDLVRR